jgi:hypothetical protein
MSLAITLFVSFAWCGLILFGWTILHIFWASSERWPAAAID